ncbi:MAG: DUF4198 domain-containing protein [Pseudomonadota bacterium]
MKHLAMLLVLGAATLAARAHDTWFAPLSRQEGGTLLALGTGNRFPKQEFAVGMEHLRMSGCATGQGVPARLAPWQQARHALLMHAAAPAPDTAGLSCWAQLLPMEIELSAETVEVYLDEIHAPQPVRQAWAERRARGAVWKERYTKHARIELGDGPPMARATGMDLDARLEAASRRPRAGEALAFQVLLAGQPLAGLPMELVDGQGASGGWAVTDAQGRLRLPAPRAGRWVLRGTHLQAVDGDAWESRFLTLAFELR